MDNVAVSKRNHGLGNKENAQPAPGSKPLIRGAKATSTAPFQAKNDNKMGAVPKAGPLKAQVKQPVTKSASAWAQNLTNVQKNGKGAVATVPRHNRAVLTEQAVKDRKMTQGAPKPLAATSSKFAAPFQLKSTKREETTTTTGPLKAQAKRVDPRSAAVQKKVLSVQRDGRGAVTTSHVKHSLASLTEKAVKAKNTSDKAPKPSALGVYKGKVIQSKIGSIWKQSATVPRTDSKPPAPKKEAQRPVSVNAVRDRVNKPVASSSLRQYRTRLESDEERRAKLAEWMASKGKTFKRPAMTTTVPAKTKVSAKPRAGLKAQSQAAEQRKPEPLPSLEADRLLAAAAPAPCADTQGAESEPPMIRNTSIDLLENSDADPSADPEDSIHDIVVNLCEALEAMATPSRCNDVFSQETGVCGDGDEEVKVKDECKEEELKLSEMTEDVEQVKLEQVKNEADNGDEQEVEMDDDDDDDCVETTPQMENSSVVKYNVKTTPYLQSVKRTLEDEAGMSASRRKSNIKDLKFLTPVRRSCRIQRKSSVLPSMLLDHDPCVSSLAELVKLDDDSNAYIYRKNDALLEDLPDQPSL